jgi:hypothetical protein
MATLFGGCAAWFWWIIVRMIIYIATDDRVMIGAWSSFFVVVGTYFLEYLMLSHGSWVMR